MDLRDWVVIGLLAAMHVSATVFLFVERSPTNFVTWAGVTSTITCAYHWMVIRDSKEKDA